VRPIQSFEVATTKGKASVFKRDAIEGPSAEWEATFSDGRRKSFYGSKRDVRHAVLQEILK
jgi:hypothetical protein